jgi:hypothetical protein
MSGTLRKMTDYVNGLKSPEAGDHREFVAG